MNLLASYNWLKEYVDLKGVTSEQFAARVSLSGPGVERLYAQGLDLEKIVVGHVTKVEPHPAADKLRVASVDIGTSKPLSIVCGGSNLGEDQWVVVAQVGAKVKWHGEGDLIELKPVAIRGVESEGMICAANEIGLFEAFPHGEREILDLGHALPDAKFKSGASFAHVLGLEGDVVADIEVTTNRPDAMCMVGLAREAAAILDKSFIWKPSPKIKEGKEKLDVRVMDKELCPRFTAIRIDGVKVGPSPWWMKRRLMSAGIRPINNVVDITNYVMLEMGQPAHVYDAEKIEGGLKIRHAEAGESLLALDGKEYALDESVLVVADQDKPACIAGIMGGEKSGVTSQSASIIFEAANWDPVHIRRTARKLNLYSQAQALFEKGLSTESPSLALARAVELCLEIAGGTIASKMTDIRSKPYKTVTHSILLSDVERFIGAPIKPAEALGTLKRLGFGVKRVGKKITAQIPWWRDHDIESGRDLVEEIARIYGYTNIPSIFPAGLASRPVDSELTWEDRVRTIAEGAGLTETYTYSFVPRSLFEKAGYDPNRLLRVQNPFSVDFECMRTSLLPSLLQVVTENQERSRALSLFEVAHAYYPAGPTNDPWSVLPNEALELGAAFLGGEDVWKKAKGFVEHLFTECGISDRDVKWMRLDNDPFWHPGRTVQAYVGERLLGTVGEVHPMIAERFKIEKNEGGGRLAMVDLPLEEVFAVASATKKYEPIPAYPEAKRDLALLVGRAVEVAALEAVMRETSPCVRSVEWFDTYRGKGIPEDKKSVAFHLAFVALDRTLEAVEVDEALARIKTKLKEMFGAEVRG